MRRTAVSTWCSHLGRPFLKLGFSRGSTIDASILSTARVVNMKDLILTSNLYYVYRCRVNLKPSSQPFGCRVHFQSSQAQ